ncbi:MAG TPA: hypothetical protein VIY55_13470 [Acetobacteraceae bacterium]
MPYPCEDQLGVVLTKHEANRKMVLLGSQPTEAEARVSFQRSLEQWVKLLAVD